jgi:glycosyltransferase involved in cell wall biosynthesis
MLSVLIPVYNYDITALVAELHNQCSATNIPYEIIVCDDHSAAAFKAANESISDIPSVKYLQNSPNLGRTATRKKLAEAAQYDNLLFLDADVIPVDDTFIPDYLPYLNKKIAVFGGYSYQPGEVSPDKVLRLAYGREREENPAAFRNTIPYGVVFSGNFLIDKQQFLENNYPGSENFYGMDIYFGYSLYKNKVKVLHTDNPIYHLGLEEDTVFFVKSLEAIKNRKLLLQQYPGMADINNLLKHYTTMKKLGLSGIVALLFKATGPLLKKMILSKKPGLFAFDLYRLGYICAVK